MPARVLITSAGSGVSRAVLAVLAARGDDVTVIGVNSQIDGVPRVDRFHLVPPLADPGFGAEFADVLVGEEPDLVIAGRDDDVVMLADCVEAGLLPESAWTGGGAALARTLRDKARAYAFARAHGLAFADTLVTGELPSQGLLKTWAEEGGPWVGKPRSGQGSRGVVVLETQDELRAFAFRGDGLIQPLLHPVAGEAADADLGMWEGDAQIVIGANGKLLATSTFASLMVQGESTKARPLPDRELSRLAHDYGEVLAENGWRGPVNVQALLDDDGGWQVIEINARFGGGCLHRYRCGFDEVGLVLSSWLGMN